MRRHLITMVVLSLELMADVILYPSTTTLCSISFSSFNSTELFALQVLRQMVNKLLGDAQKPLWFFIVIHSVWFWVLFIYLYFMLEKKIMADNLRNRHGRIKLRGASAGPPQRPGSPSPALPLPLFSPHACLPIQSTQFIRWRQ